MDGVFCPLASVWGVYLPEKLKKLLNCVQFNHNMSLRRVFFGPNQKVQKTKYVFIRPIHPPEVVSNQNFEIGTLSPPSSLGII